jgi:hypothetical protein
MTRGWCALNAEQGDFPGAGCETIHKGVCVKGSQAFCFIALDEGCSKRFAAPFLDMLSGIGSFLGLPNLIGGGEIFSMDIGYAHLVQLLLEIGAVDEGIGGSTHASPCADIAKDIDASISKSLEKICFGISIDPKRDKVWFHSGHSL